jgi:predicted ester cyclase
MLLSKSHDIIVQQFFAAIEGGFIKEAGGYLSDKFIYSGAISESLSKDAFLALNQAIVDAMPDLSFNLGNIAVDKDIVTLQVRITATHTGILSFPLFGIAPMRGTGIRIVMPKETYTVRFDQHHITQIETEKDKGGGVEGILQKLGIPIKVPVGAV